MSVSLSPRDDRLIQRLVRGQRLAAALGLTLALGSACYLAWAVTEFDPRGDPARRSAFDDVVVRPLILAYARFQARLDVVEPQTDTELRLLRGLRRSLSFSAGLMVLAMRALLATLAGGLGLAALTVVAERRRLLKIIARLQSPPPRGEPPC